MATHTRVWARHMTVTDPAHVDAAGQLRHRFQHPDRPADGDDLVRYLTDYDRAFRLTGEVR